MNFHSTAGLSELSVAVSGDIPACWPLAHSRNDDKSFLIFQSREFFAAWQASYGRTGRFTPYFVVVNRGPRPAILLPLCIERRGGLRILSFLDQGYADYNAPVLFDALGELTAEAMQSLWSEILRRLPRVDLVRLEKMPERVGMRRNPLVDLATTAEPESGHGNRLDRPWAEVEQSLFSPKELKKKERALARQAEVDFVVADDEETRSKIMSALIEQKQRRFDETFVPGFADNPASLAFLKAATETFGISGNLHLSALVVGGDIAAVQWGLTHGTTFYALVTSFSDGKWAGFSCSRLLVRRLMLTLHERGFRYFDQGIGDEPYKLQSTDTHVSLSRQVEALTLRGRVSLWRDALMARLREGELWSRLRPLKWVVLRALPSRRPQA